MVRDAVRGYWSLAFGLTELTRQKAMAAAKAMVAQGEATAEQVGGLAEELLSASAANRAALTNLVRAEIERARSAVGLAGPDDLEALRARVHELEVTIAQLRRATTAAKGTAAKGTAAKKAPAKRTAAKKAGATAGGSA